jgi:hypothetical protein
MLFYSHFKYLALLTAQYYTEKWVKLRRQRLQKKGKLSNFCIVCQQKGYKRAFVVRLRSVGQTLAQTLSKGAFTNYVDKFLPIIDHLSIPYIILWHLLYIGKNQPTVDISSNPWGPYLPRLFNVVFESPLTAVTYVKKNLLAHCLIHLDSNLDLEDCPLGTNVLSLFIAKNYLEKPCLSSKQYWEKTEGTFKNLQFSVFNQFGFVSSCKSMIKL